jgi:hypothetical protein
MSKDAMYPTKLHHPHGGVFGFDSEARKAVMGQSEASLTQTSHERRGLRERVPELEKDTVEISPPEAFANPVLEDEVNAGSDELSGEKELVIDKRPRITATIETITKGKKGERLTLSQDGIDTRFIGRVYGLKPGTVVRSSPAETRDSHVVLITTPNTIFFAVKGADTTYNGIAWDRGFTLRNNGIGKLPTFLTQGVVRKRGN